MSLRRGNLRTGLWFAAGALALAAGPAPIPHSRAADEDAKRAADREDRIGPVNPPATHAPLVRCRPETTVDLQHADDLVRRGHLADAVEKYKALMLADVDAVFADPRNNGLYVSVVEEVQRRIGKLPEAALRFYRADADPEAARLLEIGRRDGDLNALLTVARLYRHTSSGPEAADLAACRLFDTTEFARAARLWRRWVEDSPSAPPAKRASVLVRLAIASHHAGDAAAAADAVDALRKELPDAAVMVGGRRLPAAQFAANYLTVPTAIAERHAPRAGGPADRPMWGGNAAGTQLCSTADVVLQPVWRAALPALEGDRRPERRADAEKARRTAVGLLRALYPTDGPPGTPADLPWERPIPAVAGGVVYLRWTDRMSAVDMETGKLKWCVRLLSGRRKLDLPPEVRGDPSATAAITVDRGRSSVTVAEGRLYTVEDFPPTYVVGGLYEDPAAAGSRLVCRSADTGEIVWQVGRRKTAARPGKEPTEAERLVNSGTFLTAPTWSGGRLFAVVEYVDGCYGCCLDAATGRPLWSCFLCQRPGPAADEGRTGRPLMGSPPAVAGGVAYFLTNAGVLAALDEHSGSVDWLLDYRPRPAPAPAAPPAPNAPAPGDAPPPANLPLLPPSPVVVAGGKVVCLPADSDRVLAVNVTGSIAWSRSRATNIPNRPRVEDEDGTLPIYHNWLAGVVGDRVILTGPDAAALRLADGKPIWRTTVPGANRPALSADTLYLAVEGRGVARIRVNGREAAHEPPLMQRDEPGARPPVAADVVTTGGRMLLVGETEAALYLSFRDAYARAARDVAARPADAGFRRARGELCLTAGLHEPGRLEEAVADLEAAAELAAAHGPASRLIECRSSLCEACLHLAERTPADPRRFELLHRAAAVAGDPRQKAEARLRLAEESDAAGDGRRAAELAVEAIAAGGDVTLGDPARRRPASAARPEVLSAPPRPEGRPTARQEANRFLLDLIARRGPAVYETCEAAAVERFAAARAGGSPEALEAVLDGFPFSRTADECRLALAAAYRDRARGLRALVGAGPAARLSAERLYEAAADRLDCPTLRMPPRIRPEGLAAGIRRGPPPPRPPASPLLAAALAERMLLAEERSPHDLSEARAWYARLAQCDASARIGGRGGPGAAEKSVAEVLTEAGKRLYPKGVPANLPTAGTAADVPVGLFRLRVLAGDDAGGWGGAGSRLLRNADGSVLVVGDCVAMHTKLGVCLVRPGDGELVWRSFAPRYPDVPDPGESDADPNAAPERQNNSPFLPPSGRARGTVIGGKLVWWDGRRAAGPVDLETGKTGGPVTVPAHAEGAPLTQPAFDSGLLASFGFRDARDGRLRARLSVIDALSGKSLPPTDLALDNSAVGEAPDGRVPPGPVLGGFGAAVVTGPSGFVLIDPARGKVVANVEVPGTVTQLVPAPGNRLLVAACGREGDDRGGGVAAYSADGRQVWRLSVAADLTPRVVAHDRECVLISSQRPDMRGDALICADAADGRRLWTVAGFAKEFGTRFVESAVRSGDRIYAVLGFEPGAENRKAAQDTRETIVLLCLDAADGRRIWDRAIEASPAAPGLVSAPTTTPGQVVLATRRADTLGCRLHVFDRETGTPIHVAKPLTGPYLNAAPNGAGNVERRWMRAYRCALPEPVGPWVLVETPDGVEVWGAR